MTDERWKELMRAEDDLTEEEIQEGWHFCRNWDGLLIGPDMDEMESCSCAY